MRKVSTPLALALLAAPLAAGLGGCLAPASIDIPNEVRGTLHTASGGPAANVEVRLYPVGYAPGEDTTAVSAIYSTRTNASGKFTLKEMPPGGYNLIAMGQEASAFQDSIRLGRGPVALAAHTLRAPGTLAGTAALRPGDSPGTVTVRVLGTPYFTSVAAEGSFLLTLPQGTYCLRVSTTLPGYSPLFLTVRVTSGVNDTLAAPLKPY